jgi:hypothetical protein
MAIGTTGFLLILAIGLVNVFLSEMRINRMVHDGILSYAAAEWGFEYAMLKIRNHRDGFQDAVKSSDIDASLLRGNLPRSQDIVFNYEVISQSTDSTLSILPGEYLILPLFVGDDNLIVSGWNSKLPTHSSSALHLTQVEVTWLLSDTAWTILGMSGGTTVGITGAWNITAGTSGTMRNKGVDCYDANGDKKPSSVAYDAQGNCPSGYSAEVIEYLYDTTMSVGSFLSNPGIKDRYISIFHGWSSPLQNIRVKSDTPFSLPIYTLVTTGKIWNTSQSIQFSEDKSRLYDALKYGLYNE